MPWRRRRSSSRSTIDRHIPWEQRAQACTDRHSRIHPLRSNCLKAQDSIRLQQRGTQCRRPASPLVCTRSHSTHTPRGSNWHLQNDTPSSLDVQPELLHSWMRPLTWSRKIRGRPRRITQNDQKGNATQDPGLCGPRYHSYQVGDLANAQLSCHVGDLQTGTLLEGTDAYYVTRIVVPRASTSTHEEHRSMFVTTQQLLLMVCCRRL
jgi:hypothetical protein